MLQSRNGTYINDKHIIGQKTDLTHNDIISFGFNSLKLYNIKDKQAFIYRVIKEEDLDTINIYDSDENDDAHEDDEVVVVLDSDSADAAESEFATDDEIRDIDDDVIISSDDEYLDGDSDDSIESGGFVVTERVNNCTSQRPPINLCIDDEIEITNTETKKTDNNDDQVDKEVNKEINTEQQEDDGSSLTPSSVDILAEEKVNKDENSISNGGDNSVTNTNKNVNHADVDNAKTLVEQSDAIVPRSVPGDAKARRCVRIISAQPLRKRRRTITESEYEDAKKKREQKRLARAERLAQLAKDEKESKNATEATATPTSTEIECKRSIAVPKVKNSEVSRAEMLATDMLADSTK